MSQDSGSDVSIVVHDTRRLSSFNFVMSHHRVINVVRPHRGVIALHNSGLGFILVMCDASLRTVDSGQNIASKQPRSASYDANQ